MRAGPQRLVPVTVGAWVPGFLRAAVSTNGTLRRGCPLDLRRTIAATPAALSLLSEGGVHRGQEAAIGSVPGPGHFGNGPFTGCGEGLDEGLDRGFLSGRYTSGCGVGPLVYCPESRTKRAEMAVFIHRAYNRYPWQSPRARLPPPNTTRSAVLNEIGSGVPPSQ
jgi:hypothetical protein